MKKTGLNNFKQLNSKELNKIQGGIKYYIEINGSVVVVEM